MIAGLDRFKLLTQKLLLLRCPLALCPLALYLLALCPLFFFSLFLFSFASCSLEFCPLFLFTLTLFSLFLCSVALCLLSLALYSLAFRLFYAKLMRLNYRQMQKMVLTKPLRKAESLDIHCTVEVLDHRRQVFVHYFNRLQVRRPTCSRCDHQPLSNPEEDHLPRLT